MKRLIVLVLAATAVAGCASTAPPSAAPSTPASAVPAEFRAACGHPGAQVEVRKVPVTIRHAACDLTGVAVSYRNRGGATVPPSPGGIANSNGFDLEVHSGSRNVTVTVTGPAGND